MSYLELVSQLYQCQFYHGNISEEKANQLLKNEPSGTFLVRVNPNFNSTNPHFGILSYKYLSRYVKHTPFLLIQKTKYVVHNICLENFVGCHNCGECYLRQCLAFPLIRQSPLSLKECSIAAIPTLFSSTLTQNCKFFCDCYLLTI